MASNDVKSRYYVDKTNKTNKTKYKNLESTSDILDYLQKINKEDDKFIFVVRYVDTDKLNKLHNSRTYESTTAFWHWCWDDQDETIFKYNLDDSTIYIGAKSKQKLNSCLLRFANMIEHMD